MTLTNEGWLHRENHLVVFFGLRHIDRSQLKERFPELNWATLEQIHSPSVVLANSLLERRGDAHFTDDPRLGLIVKTADCVPVLLASDRGHVAAVHAGWRGVVTDIVPNTIRQLNRVTEKSPLRAWIGPHIQWQSFEVRDDVGTNLRLAYHRALPQGNFSELCRKHPEDPNKIFVSLTEVVRTQLRAQNVKIVDEIIDDTKTSPGLASYRRDGQNAGRNLSFIARL